MALTTTTHGPLHVILGRPDTDTDLYLYLYLPARSSPRPEVDRKFQSALLDARDIAFITGRSHRQ